ncbi:hypothetical protein Tco_0408490 [Tanacetum coccineum]
MGGSYYPIPCSILSIGKDQKTLQRYPDVPTTSWRILSEAWTCFKDLLQKFPHYGIDLWLQLRDLNPEESWAILEDLALYDNESWNDPRDFVRPVKEIALPQDVPSTFDRRLIELENQVQCLMEAHLAPAQPTQVNKVSSPCKICSGPHDTQYCMKNPEQASVDYTSSRIIEVGGKRFTLNQGPRNFNEATNTWKEKPNFNWALTQTFTSPQGGSVSIYSSSYQIKLEKALLDFDSNHEKSLISMVKGKEEVKEQGIDKSEMETEVEVEEVIEEEESEFETDEEVEEILEEEKDDEDGENFISSPTKEELTHHGWLLKNPRPPWVKVIFDEKKLGSS